LSVSHSVCEEDYCILIETWCYDCTYQSEGLKTVGGDAVRDTDSRSLFHFPHHLWNRGYFRRFTGIIVRSPADFHDTWWNDCCWQGNGFM